MIEKLQTWQRPLPNNPAVVENMGMDNKSLFEKINEIINELNHILEERESGIKVYEEAQDMYDNAILDALKDKQVDVVVEPTDPYAEQRKWIGKLCRFWDDNYKITKHFGILTRIDETAIVRYEAENGFWYCACEPVKPDDDIIYKG